MLYFSDDHFSEDPEKPPKKPKKIKPVDADGHRQRMRDRLFSALNHLIPPRDVLEMLLYYVIRIADTRDIAVALFKRFNKKIRSVLAADPDELMSVDGIGTKSVIFLKIVDEAARRLRSPEPHVVPEVYPTPEAIQAFFRERAAEITADETWIAYLDLNYRLISFSKLADGPLCKSTPFISTILASDEINNTQHLAFLHVAPDSNLFLTPEESASIMLLRAHFTPISIDLLEYMIICSDRSRMLSEEGIL